MEKILNWQDQIINFWASLNVTRNPFFILDIILVAILIYWVYIFLRQTRAMRIIYGIVILLILFFVSQQLNLVALNFLLKGITPMLVVAIPVVFQPELRSALERLGRADIVSDFRKLKRSEISQLILEIIDAIKNLARKKVGALIVIEQKTGLKNIIDTGTQLNAKVTSELIQTVFYPNTLLHDGAIIIKGDKIKAAGCTLPLSEDKFDFHIGTRHRAALGLSEQSDAIIVVVSEEKGTVSIASKGILNQDISIDKLKDFLEELIQQGRLKKIIKSSNV